MIPTNTKAATNSATSLNNRTRRSPTLSCGVMEEL
jgi:hypothetical protein